MQIGRSIDTLLKSTRNGEEGDIDMIEIKPKIDPLSTEGMMMYFAECLQNYCKHRQGLNACKNCVFYKKDYGCKIGEFNPEFWKLGDITK